MGLWAVGGCDQAELPALRRLVSPSRVPGLRRLSPPNIITPSCGSDAIA